ncbi:MAG: hypothetical protein ACI9SC_001822 [Gammaproteobacteria bacterium]|jgi:hypothetical protein
MIVDIARFTYSMNTIDSRPVEGEDYFLENGFHVWTAHYLEKRGYCCDCQCRHCPYEFLNNKKVISLVPSWTNTLIECEVQVVGRTKFCIHPANSVGDIKVMGGTKNLKAEVLNSVEADLVLLDKQENPVGFLDDINKPVYASDVNCVESLFQEMINLNKILSNEKLNRLIIKLENLIEIDVIQKDLHELPGIIEWLNPIQEKIENVLYVIWKQPWMCVSKKTFIASMLEHLGFGKLIPDFDTKYPEILFADYNPNNTLLLFSSEPFPFHKKTEEIRGLNYPSAIIDGEAYSWFGSRAIEFLERNK